MLDHEVELNFEFRVNNYKNIELYFEFRVNNYKNIELYFEFRVNNYKNIEKLLLTGILLDFLLFYIIMGVCLLQ